MNKFIRYGLILTAFILSGCITTITPYEKDRVDQEITGNRGMVRGPVPELPAAERKKTRTMYNIEIELSSRFKDKKEKKEAVSYVRGNKGYIERRDIPEKKSRESLKQRSMEIPEQEEIRSVEEASVPWTPQVIYQAPVEPEQGTQEKKEAGLIKEEEKVQKIYVVKKGDTLQKISDKMYGSTKKWQKIYDANKDVLKSPDLIKVGQKLVIPE